MKMKQQKGGTKGRQEEKEVRLKICLVINVSARCKSRYGTWKTTEMLQRHERPGDKLIIEEHSAITME
jgi:hypothetical protein